MDHVNELDGIRALAILIVYVSHAGLGKWVPGGLGVTIFFFLSGYLITSLMRVEAQALGTINIPNFYLRRVLRIVPPMWIVLFVTYLMTKFNFITAEIDPFAVPSQLFFLINYAHLWGHDIGIPGIPLWSLAVEEHFYLLFPLIYVTFFLRVAPRQAAAWCVSACVVVLMFRLIHVVVFGELFSTYYWSHTRIDSILFGCCLALWHNPIIDGKTAWKPRTLHLIMACAAIVITLLIRSEVFRETLRYTIQGVALFVAFSYVLQRHAWTSAILNNYVAQRIGLYSYTIYLIHVPLLSAMRENLPGLSGILQGCIGAFASIAFAAIMYTIVERPLARIRQRLHKSAPVLSATFGS